MRSHQCSSFLWKCVSSSFAKFVIYMRCTPKHNSYGNVGVELSMPSLRQTQRRKRQRTRFRRTLCVHSKLFINFTLLAIVIGRAVEWFSSVLYLIVNSLLLWWFAAQWWKRKQKTKWQSFTANVWYSHSRNKNRH